MKRYLVSLILIFALVQTSFAQDIDLIISNISKVEGAEYQVVDRESLNSMLEAAMEADSTDNLAKQIPSFIKNVEEVKVLTIEEYPVEIVDNYLKDVLNIKEGGDFEILFSVNEDEDQVRILKKKTAPGELNEISLIVVDDEDIVVIKMTGNFTDDDIKAMIEEHNKQNQ